MGGVPKQKSIVECQLCTVRADMVLSALLVQVGLRPVVKSWACSRQAQPECALSGCHSLAPAHSPAAGPEVEGERVSRCTATFSWSVEILALPEKLTIC